MHVGILGGTGPAGRGLSARLAAAGIDVTIGSRHTERAEEMAASVVDAWPSRRLAVGGAENEVAAGADLVIVATPWDSAIATVTALRQPLAGKVVVSMVAPLVKLGRQIRPVTMPRGSLAAELAAVLPDSRVAAAFHHLPADDLADLDQGVMADVLVCADDRPARESTMSLVDSIDGLRALDAGTLSIAGTIEAFTAVLIAVNTRYKAHTVLRLGGI